MARDRSKNPLAGWGAPPSEQPWRRYAGMDSSAAEVPEVEEEEEKAPIPTTVPWRAAQEREDRERLRKAFEANSPPKGGGLSEAIAGGPRQAASSSGFLVMTKEMTRTLEWCTKFVTVLPGWAQEFVLSLKGYVAKHGGLTPKQWRKLQEVHNRARTGAL